MLPIHIQQSMKNLLCCICIGRDIRYRDIQIRYRDIQNKK